MKKISSGSAAEKSDFVHLREMIDEGFKRFESRFASLEKDMATKKDLSDLEQRLEQRMEEDWKRNSKHLAVEIMSHVDVRYEQFRSDYLAPLELLLDHSKRIRRLETKAGIV